ncbi:MAG: hypothetical protein POELPBGB_02557 [Bacteroidia bacterium]|nr:hypothetical protein [Bacteroidia bacterium]
MGEIKRQGIQNTVIVNIATVIGFASTLIIQPYFLKPEEIGLTRTLYSLSTLIASLVPLGMSNAVYKFFPQFRDKENRHFGFFTFMNLYVVAGFVLVALLVCFFREKIIEAYAVKSPLISEFFDYIFPFSFFLAFISVFSIYSASLFKSSVPAFFTEITTKLFPVAVISVYYLGWIDIRAFVMLYVLCFGLIFLLLLVYIFTIDKPLASVNRHKFNNAKVKEILIYSGSFSFAALASLGLKNLDIVLIGMYVPLALAGVYATVAIIPAVIEIPLHALEKIAAAKISDAFTHSRIDEVKNIYYRASKYLFLAGGLLFLGVNLNIHKLLWLLPQEKGFRLGENVVHIITFGALFNMATSVNNPILYNSQYYSYGLGMLVFLTVVSYVNYSVFIPLWGMEGAAFATALSSILYNFLKFFFIWRKMGMQPFDFSSLKIALLIAACSLLYFVNIDLGAATLEIAVMSLLITAVYVTGVYYLKIVPELFQVKHISDIKKRLGF